MGARILEVLAFRNNLVEYMEWEPNSKGILGSGSIVSVSARDNYWGYPTGMGGRRTLPKEDWERDATALVEMGTDWYEMVDAYETLTARVIRIRRNRTAPLVNDPGITSPDWARWPGGTFTHIYTDGSHAEDCTMRQFLLGKRNQTAGGCIVLTDCHSWVHRIRVVVDVEVKKAFDVELICLLIANEIAEGITSPVVIHSDCQAAINVANGARSHSFSNTINGWRKGTNVEIVKVRAHPERHKPYEEWDWNDKGIWTADRVAGGQMDHDGSVLASSWLKRIGFRSQVVIEEEDGTPFIGSVQERASRKNIESYWIRRDEWRVQDGLDPMWEGTNMAMAAELLKRNGGLEDYATMLRLSSGKRWNHSRHNPAVCNACQELSTSMKHPLLHCENLAMVAARELWTKNCKAYAASAKPDGLRGRMLEALHHVLHSPDGEFAAMGTFTPRWASNFPNGDITPIQELRAFKKFLRVIAAGARLVMREYARIKGVEEGDARELRQLSINQFTRPEEPLRVLKPTPSTTHCGTSPPDNVWRNITSGTSRKLEWTLPLVGARAEISARASRPSMSQRKLAVTPGTGTTTTARAKKSWAARATGLQWYSPYK